MMVQSQSEEFEVSRAGLSWLGRALFGGHTAITAGTSFFVATPMFFLSRLFSTVLILAVISYNASLSHFPMNYFTNWGFVLLLVSSLLLTLTSPFVVFDQAWAADCIAMAAVPIHYVSATISLYSFPAYIVYATRMPGDLAAMLASMVHVVTVPLDVALGAQYVFNLAHALLATLFFCRVLRLRVDTLWRMAQKPGLFLPAWHLGP